MRLYISGPMTGVEFFNRPAFERTRAVLRKQGHFVIDPTELDAIPIDTTEQPDILWKLFLSRDAVMLLSCRLDGIVLLKGWEKSRGARLELMAALATGMHTYRLSGMVGEALDPILIENIPVGDLQ